MVGSQDHAGEFGECVGVFVGSVGAADHRQSITPAIVLDQVEPVGDDVNGLGPADFDQLFPTSDERSGEPVLGSQVLEPEARLVREPAVVGGVVVDACVTEDLVLACVNLYPWVSRVLEGGAHHLLQVPGTRPEPVWRGREGAHRAYLDCVAGEVGRKRQIGECVDLGEVAPIQELDQWIP